MTNFACNLAIWSLRDSSSSSSSSLSHLCCFADHLDLPRLSGCALCVPRCLTSLSFRRILSKGALRALASLLSGLASEVSSTLKFCATDSLAVTLFERGPFTLAAFVLWSILVLLRYRSSAPSCLFDWVVGFPAGFSSAILPLCGQPTLPFACLLELLSPFLAACRLPFSLLLFAHLFLCRFPSRKSMFVMYGKP